MIRLIDADALLEAARQYEIKSKTYYVFLDLITNAHTVQREGWVSVPIEPTEEMCNAGAPHCNNNNFTSMMVYKAMLDAAPTGKE